MKASTLLAELACHGVELRCSGGRLRFRAPNGAFTAELRDRVASARAAILELLRPEKLPPPPRAACERVTWLWRLARGADLSALELFSLIDALTPTGPLGPYGLSEDQAATVAHQIRALALSAPASSISTTEEPS